MTKKKRKKRKKKTVKRNSPPISAVRVKSLGYDCENLTEADKLTELDVSLTELFDKYPKLKEAWERGQFLRKVYQYADSVETVTQAARKLGLASGEAFRELLDTDKEVVNIWNNKRDDTRIAARKGIINAASEGNPTAVKYVEGFLKDDDNRTTPVSNDTKRLTQIAIAELFVVERQTIRNWEEKYGCPRNTDKTYDLARVIAWYKDYAGSQSAPKADSKDKLRDLKAEEKELDLKQRRHQLLPREEVIEDFVSNYQNIVGSLHYKSRELASLCHGQTVDGIEQILLRFFEDILRQWSEVPESLHLSAEASEKLIELMSLIRVTDDSNTGKSNTAAAKTV